MSYTYNDNMKARLIWTNAAGEQVEEIVTVPDMVADDQKDWDGKIFLTAEGDTVMLDGDAYGLHGTGTGDMIVRIPWL